MNPRLTLSCEEFVKVMDNLNLPKPQQIGEQLGARFLGLREEGAQGQNYNFPKKKGSLDFWVPSRA